MISAGFLLSTGPPACVEALPKPWIFLTHLLTLSQARYSCCANLDCAQNVSHLPLRGTNDNYNVDLRMRASVNRWCLGESRGRKCRALQQNKSSAEC